jgi:DNA-binding XRE family transcriptional regulator
MKRELMKRIRAGKGYTQLSLAEKIGCKERDITLIETGRSSPTFGLACRIAETLGEPREKLFPELN